MTSTVDYMPLRDVVAAPWDKVTPTRKDKAATFFAWLGERMPLLGRDAV